MNLRRAARRRIALIAFITLVPVLAHAQDAMTLRVAARSLTTTSSTPVAPHLALLVPDSDNRAACIGKRLFMGVVLGAALGEATGRFAGQFGGGWHAERRQLLLCTGLGVLFGTIISWECLESEPPSAPNPPL